MLSREAAAIVLSLDREIGEGWYRHQFATGASDELLHCIIGDGIFSTKIDGFIHAATMTTPFILKHMEEMERDGFDELDLEHLTSWKPTDSAIRYAHWQLDFHWKIDTRAWQYNLLVKFMRRSYHDAISAAPGLSEEDRQLLLRGNLAFWDAVEISYSYRSEILERSRGFAPHPDRTAGAHDHGYVYRPIVPAPTYSFSKLRFELIGTELGAGTDHEEEIPVGYPRLPDVTHGELTEAARAWMREAKLAELCDDYLRVRLGVRFVPTRINGWEAAMQDVCRYISLDRDDPLIAALDDVGKRPLNEEVVRFFALTQLEFGRRLEGLDKAEFLVLLHTARAGIDRLLAGKPEAGGADGFYNGVREVCDQTINDALPEEYAALIDLVRPFHPRYAAFDPREPLPWHAKNPTRYMQRMERLGYEL